MSTPNQPEPRAEESIGIPAQQQIRVTMKLRSQHPVATYVIGGLTILIFVLQTVSQWLLKFDLPVALGALSADLVERGQFWRLITAAFLHGSILHIGLNMWMLYILGRALEPHYGHRRFALLYLVSAFSGNVFSFLLLRSTAIGAATGLFGLLIAEGVMVLQNRPVFGDRARGMLTQIVIITAINLSIGLVPGFDGWGGMGGVLGGLAFAWFAGPVWGLRAGLFEMDIEDTRGDGNAWRVFLIEALILSVLVIQHNLLA